MVQVLYDIKVCLVDSMVLKSMEDWLQLNAVKSFLLVHICKAQLDAVHVQFFFELVDSMEMVNHWEAWYEASLLSRLVGVEGQQYQLQEDVWKHVNDGQQTDWPVVLYVWHVALLVQQDHHYILPCF